MNNENDCEEERITNGTKRLRAALDVIAIEQDLNVVEALAVAQICLMSVIDHAAHAYPSKHKNGFIRASIAILRTQLLIETPPPDEEVTK